jgi:two-component system OmpR family sensor kinase/two-component system sensor histidine kinase QseC
MWRNGWSLQRRVYSVAAVAILVSWLSGGLALYDSAQREYEHMCHANLASLAETILSFAEHELYEVAQDGPRVENVAPVHAETAVTLAPRYAYQVWSSKGQLLLRSIRAPAVQPLGRLGNAGLTEVDDQGAKHDVFVLVAPSQNMEIHVSDQGSDDAILASSAVMRTLALVFIVSLLPVLLVTWLLMRNAFEGLANLTSQLRARKPSDSTPLQVARPPIELRPLIGSVNGLLSAVGHALDKERGFTSLAAHELRTPLSAMRVQAQVLARAESQSERSQGAVALLSSVDRCARLVNQLLELARADSQAVFGGKLRLVKVDEACADVLSDFIDEADRRRIAFSCSLSVGELEADALALQTLLRNLVSNAMRHTPDSGVIAIYTEQGDEGVILRVDDSGAGIPESERENVFRRFYRGVGAPGLGVGLGLAIVSSIVSAHRAVVRLGQAPLGGLRVEVQFPKLPAHLVP